MKWLNYFKLQKLDWYIIKKFLGTYFFMLALIIVVIVVFDYNENIDKFVTSNAKMKEIIFDYYVNLAPYYANTFSALFVFISVIYFTSKMAENSEITAPSGPAWNQCQVSGMMVYCSPGLSTISWNTLTLLSGIRAAICSLSPSPST